MLRLKPFKPDPKRSQLFYNVARDCDSAFLPGCAEKFKGSLVSFCALSNGDYFPFGIVRVDFVPLLKRFPSVFYVFENDKVANDFNTTKKPKDWAQMSKGVYLNPDFKTCESRSAAIQKCLFELREMDLLPALRGWRNEEFKVAETFQGDPLLNIERSACGLFAIRSYGTHINGFVLVKPRNQSSGGDDNFDEIKMWMSKRSMAKPTWPGMMDNIVAGGLPTGTSPFDNVVKECEEEASIPEEIARGAVPAGVVSYVACRDRGFHRESQFVYDLLLPESFSPVVCDGEASDFYLLSLDEVVDCITNPEIVKPNVALVCLHFLFRYGAITPENEPRYTELLAMMTRNLDDTTLLFRMTE
eukprot:Nk52_evm62s1737 gene=Nk52_evmTU62s1737